MFNKKKDPSAPSAGSGQVAQGKTDKPPVLETPKVEEDPSAPSAGSGQDVAQGKPVDLRELIEKNIKWTQVVYEQNRKIKNRLNLMVLGSYIRLALILIPLILAGIFLPPLLKQWFSQYGDLLQGLGMGGDAAKNGANVDSTQLQDMLQNILKGR